MWQAPIVAYVGRLAAQKGMDVLLSALPAIINAHCAAEGDLLHSWMTTLSPVPAIMRKTPC